MNIEKFKTMISVVPKHKEPKRFIPLVLKDNTLTVSDGAVIFKYNNVDTQNCDVGISWDDYNIIKKIKIESIEVKDGSIYFNGSNPANTADRMIYEQFDSLFNTAKENCHEKMNIFPVQCKGCKIVVLNKSGIIYLSKDNEIIDSISMPMSDNLIAMQYTYIKNIFDMYRYFKVIPDIKFRQDRIMFSSENINGVLMTFRLNDNLHSKFSKYQCKGYDEW